MKSNKITFSILLIAAMAALTLFSSACSTAQLRSGNLSGTGGLGTSFGGAAGLSHA